LEIGSGAIPEGASDLGDAALLPGLVNAHTHLEFSDLVEPIGVPGMPLHQWIGQIVGARLGTSAESKQAAIQNGIQQLVDSGTRLVGEIATPPCQYRQAYDQIDLVAFAEVLGLDPIRADERFDAAMDHNESYEFAAFSPHAPYSTTLGTVDRCIEQARRLDRPIAMHVAESPDERELLSTGTGPFADALRSMGVWRDEIFPWGNDPFTTLIERLALATRSLLVHGNDFNDQEIDQLVTHPNLTVVYCPRTHHFFGHDKHPVDRMLAAGVRVALGTDSKASNPDLSIWKEVQFLLNHRPDIDPSEVLRMATINGAEALGRSDIGRIELGGLPGLGFVATDAVELDDVYRDLSQGVYRPIALSPEI
jgi:cytosine/adenosine deaminase-related metal-dependent hydrolase